MKTKVGTILEEEVVQQLKERAAKEKRPQSEIIQDALLQYLNAGPKKLDLRKKALQSLCSRPFALSGIEMDLIMMEDYYEQ